MTMCPWGKGSPAHLCVQRGTTRRFQIKGEIHLNARMVNFFNQTLSANRKTVCCRLHSARKTVCYPLECVGQTVCQPHRSGRKAGSVHFPMLLAAFQAKTSLVETGAMLAVPQDIFLFPQKANSSYCLMGILALQWHLLQIRSLSARQVFLLNSRKSSASLIIARISTRTTRHGQCASELTIPVLNAAQRVTTKGASLAGRPLHSLGNHAVKIQNRW